MAEVLVSFETPVTDELGTYYAKAVGRQADDGMWDGWLEFIASDGSPEVLVSPVESRQPERPHLVYWATGLTPVYLEGALRRARKPITVRVKTVEMPASSAPKPRVETTRRVMPPGPQPVLDPFEVGGKSLDILGQELAALNRPRLLNIITAYELNPTHEDLGGLSDAQLVRFIVVAVETRLMQRTRG